MLIRSSHRSSLPFIFTSTFSIFSLLWINMIPKLTWGYESFSFPYLSLFSQLSKQSCAYLEILVVKLFSLSGSN